MAMEQGLVEQLPWGKFLYDTTLFSDSFVDGPPVASLHIKAQSPQEIFSNSSILVNQPLAVSSQTVGSSDVSWGVAISIIFILSLYCWIIYRYHKQIRASLKALLSFEDTFFIFENLTLDFKRFFRYSRFTLFASIALTLAHSMKSHFTDRSIDLLVVALAIVYLFTSLWIQKILVWLVAGFDSTPHKLKSVLPLSLFDWATISIVFCPLALIMVSIPGLGIGVWFLLSVMLIAHWVRLFVYFKLTGFSILQWFLYLCTLEAIPLTIIGGIVLRLNIL